MTVAMLAGITRTRDPRDEEMRQSRMRRAQVAFDKAFI